MALTTSSPATQTFPTYLARLVRDRLHNSWKSLQWAWLDTVCQYRRSRIGPLWETINVIVMLLGLSLVSSAIFGSNLRDIVGYVAIGIIVWSAIAALISEGTMSFVRNTGYVTSSTLDVDLYVGRSVFKVFITFAHHVLVYVLGVAIGFIPIGWTSLLAIPGILLLFINGFWVVTTFAFICARFRDIDPIVRNLLQLAFFVTPVFWNYKAIASDRMFIVDYNIIFYFIEIVRSPLLGEIPPLSHYLVIGCVTVVGYLIAWQTYRRMRPRLAFFV
jgi:ABC-type polysaccharide/polyol phosphate export permease